MPTTLSATGGTHSTGGFTRSITLPPAIHSQHTWPYTTRHRHGRLGCRVHTLVHMHLYCYKKPLGFQSSLLLWY